jgi:predicted acylesterase/phospholipase RssA
MQDADILRDTVYISSVSGGSVLGTHLVLNWARYTNNEQRASAADEIRKFVMRDVRGRIVRRWPIYRMIGRTIFEAPEWSMSGLFQRELIRLYGTHTLDDLHGNGKPLLEILSTSMSNGRPMAFKGDRSIYVDRNSATPEPVRADFTPLTLAVAASAAFPPLFTPLEISHKTLKLPEDHFPLPHAATDGGVFDNLGIQILRWSDYESTENLQLSHVILSDAGAPLTKSYTTAYSNPLTRQTRAFDVIMARNAELLLESLRGDDNFYRKVAECRIAESDLDFGTDEIGILHRQRRWEIPNVRTDFDAFSKLEVALIERHGYLVAKRAWQRLTQALGTAAEVIDCAPSSSLAPNIDTKAGLRKEVRIPWSWDLRDLLTWLYLMVLVALAMLLLIGITIGLFFIAPRLGKWMVEFFSLN